MNAQERRAFAHCERVARAHYENFPVASLLLPAAMRPHIAAIYAFARKADDFADEPGLPDAERFRLLDEWRTRLRRAAGDGFAIGHNRAEDDDLIFAALGITLRRHALPVALFEDLLSAFEQDIKTKRYSRWEDVLDYCGRSANPVGRLVLRVAGYADPVLDAASDAVCTALQLTNFWQDLGRDLNAGRLYVPLADLDRFGARESDLIDERMTPQWRSALSEMISRTRTLFLKGRIVCDGVQGRLGWELRLTWLGGLRVLDKVARARQVSFTERPTLGLRDVPWIMRRAILWQRWGNPPETLRT